MLLASLDARHVDGKVRVCKAHLELVAILHARHHVFYVRRDGAKARELRALPVQDVHAHQLLAHHRRRKRITLERPLERAAGALDGHRARLDGDSHWLGWKEKG